MRGFKVIGEYVALLPSDFYAQVPKAVWAAIALSVPVNGGATFVSDADMNEPIRWVLREWKVLHVQGIVPQPPPSGRKWGIVDVGEET